MEKCKENEILLTNFSVLECENEVISVKNKESLLNTVYKEIADKLGIEAAKEIFRMFKGQQITFPVRFLNPTAVRGLILKEYNGSNTKDLAQKYNYSEKTIRRIIKENGTSDAE